MNRLISHTLKDVGIRCRLGMLCVALAAAWCTRSAGAVEPADRTTTAWTTQSEPFQGRLVEVTSDGQAIFQSATGKRTIPSGQLIEWGAALDRVQGGQILLADGGILAADAVHIDETSLTLAGRIWQETAIPRSAVRGILFRTPLDPRTRDRLVDQLYSNGGPEDRLILASGDQLAGRLVTPFQPEAGALLPAELRWQVSGRAEPITVSIERIVALALHTDRLVTSVNTQHWFVGFRDGSRVVVQRIVRKTDHLDIRSSNSVDLMTEPTSTRGGNPWGRVVAIRSLTANVVYLSDLEPIGYKHIPYLGIAWPYHRDRNVLGGHLRHGDFLFEKGIGMHSSARLAYDVNPHFRWLEAELAIDACAGNAGSVTFRVYQQGADGKWSLAYESCVIRGGQPRQPMRVDVRQASRIALIVDVADRADQWDHADWLNARLVP